MISFGRDQRARFVPLSNVTTNWWRAPSVELSENVICDPAACSRSKVERKSRPFIFSTGTSSMAMTRSPICTPADSAGLPGIRLLTQARLIGPIGNDPFTSHAIVNQPEGIRVPETIILLSTTGASFSSAADEDLSAAIITDPAANESTSSIEPRFIVR